MTFQDETLELTKVLAELEGATGKALARAVEAVCRSLRAGGKLLIFGNGGSAAEAQHFAAELVNKFRAVRPAIRALALTTDTSVLTSVGNDLAFDQVFSRQVEALGDRGDVALALSTSGVSPNVLHAVKTAKRLGLVSVGFTGRNGGPLAGLVDHWLAVPSDQTPRVQEAHLFLLHRLALEVEACLFKS